MILKRLAGHISSFSLNFINIHNYDDIYIRQRSPTTQKQEVLMQRIKLGNERIREEGRQEGQREGVERIALRMLADRIDDKDIIRLTKLTAQQLAELKKRA